MKILIINSDCGSGSTGRIAYQIADSVIRNGGDSRIVYGRSYYEKSCNVPTYRIGTDLGVKIHALLSRITDRQGFFSKRATKKLLKYINIYKPDIINLHNIHGYYIHIPTLFKFLEKYDKPVVWTLHDCWSFTGHCAYFEYIGCEKWEKGCFKCPQIRNYPKSCIFDNSKKNWIDKKLYFCSIKKMILISPSQWLADLVKQSYLKKYPIRVINNGIDINIFKKIKTNWKEENSINKPIVLACASKWDERKGLDDILQLAKKLIQYQFVIVGLSKSQTKNISKNIICFARTENILELVKIYNAADVFINPTYEDNYPTVNLEAISCGTPVITYRSGGSHECINQNIGMVVDRGNIAEMERCISIAISLKNNIKIEDRHSNIKMAKEYYCLFKNLIN